jgi:hypothetical protein
MGRGNAAPDLTAVTVMSDRLRQHHYRRKDQLHGSHEHGGTLFDRNPASRQAQAVFGLAITLPVGVGRDFGCSFSRLED